MYGAIHTRKNNYVFFLSFSFSMHFILISYHTTNLKKISIKTKLNTHHLPTVDYIIIQHSLV